MLLRYMLMNLIAYFAASYMLLSFSYRIAASQNFVTQFNLIHVMLTQRTIIVATRRMKSYWLSHHSALPSSSLYSSSFEIVKGVCTTSAITSLNNTSEYWLLNEPELRGCTTLRWRWLVEDCGAISTLLLDDIFRRGEIENLFTSLELIQHTKKSDDVMNVFIKHLIRKYMCYL